MAKQNATKFRLKIAILPNDTILVPGCEFSTSVTATTYTTNEQVGCEHPTLKVQTVLNAIPGSRVVKLAGGTGIHSNRFLELPDGPTPDCCVPVTDWYKILRSLMDPTAEETMFDECRVVNYNPADDNLMHSDIIHRKSPYVTPGYSPYAVAGVDLTTGSPNAPSP